MQIKKRRLLCKEHTNDYWMEKHTCHKGIRSKLKGKEKESEVQTE